MKKKMRLTKKSGVVDGEYDGGVKQVRSVQGIRDG